MALPTTFPPGEINIIATIQPEPSKVNELLGVVGELVKAVKAKEPDVLVYYAIKSESPDGHVEITFVEKYLNEQTLKAHMVTDHYQKFAHLSPALIAQDKDPRIIIGSGI